jgi:hypothetical protein
MPTASGGVVPVIITGSGEDEANLPDSEGNPQ